MASRTAVIAQRILAAVSANGPQSLARGVTTLAVEGTGGLSSRLFSSVPILQVPGLDMQRQQLINLNAAYACNYLDIQA